MRLPPAKAPDARFLEEIVTGEDFIGTFARKHDLQFLFAHKARKLEKRCRCGAQDRLFHIPDHGGEDAGYVVRPAVYGVMPGAKRARHDLLIGAFVEFSIVEGDGKAAQARRSHVRGKCRNDRGIEPAGKEGAYFDIGAQADAGGIFQQIAQLRRHVVFAGMDCRVAFVGEGQRPVWPHARLPVLDDHHMRGRQLQNAFEGGARRNRCPQREYLVECDGIDAAFDTRHLKQGLHFRGKIKRAAVVGMEQRPHPHAVARQHHTAAALVQYDKGEVAVEVADEVRAKFFIEVQQHLRVADGAETASARLEHSPQFDVIEDLAIVGDADRAVRIGHGLGGIGRQVDDGQAAMSEPRAGTHMDALAIGAAMGNRPAHAPQQRRGLLRRQGAAIAGYAAHRSRHPLKTGPRSNATRIPRQSR